MEKIRIGTAVQLYDIKSIVPEGEHVIRIVFADSKPDAYGDVAVFTSGGIQCANLPGFGTVYKQDGQTVWLSDDESVYEESVAPVQPDPEPYEPYVPTLEEVKAAKKTEVSAACENVIFKGIDAKLSDGSVQHFSLTEKDQINLFGKQAQIAAGAEQLEYHADGSPCEYYNVEDMTKIIQNAMFWVSYHTTYCNALNMWIAGCESADDVNEIFYGADVPEKHQSEVLKNYLIQIAAMEGVENETVE